MKDRNYDYKIILFYFVVIKKFCCRIEIPRMAIETLSSVLKIITHLKSLEDQLLFIIKGC